MYIVLLILCYALWFLTGFFIARSIKQRKQLRELHYAEFFNYPIRKEKHERETQEGIDEMGNVLREHNSSLFDF